MIGGVVGAGPVGAGVGSPYGAEKRSPPIVEMKTPSTMVTEICGDGPPSTIKKTSELTRYSGLLS
jgi:hypothetical protein